MATNGNGNPLSKIKPHKIILPVIIGLAAVAYMFWKEFEPGSFSAIEFGKWTVIWLAVAIVLMLFRDIGYILRLMILTDGEFTFRKALRVIMLWEFTSAITPSAIGGTSVAILYVNKEGLSVGRSSAVVMATSFLDELYFILMFPLLLFIVKPSTLFSTGLANTGDFSLTNSLLIIAGVGFLVKLIYVAILSYGLFVNPRGLKWLLLWIFKLPILRRWKHGANAAGYEIISNSKSFKQKPLSFWLKAFGATFFSWTSRYWVANALLLAFFPIGEHLLIFARQLVMWIMMLVSPTPGGSGFAEYVFTKFLGEFIPVEPVMLGSVVVALALLWRIVSYYPYLIIGAIMFPKWIKDKFIDTETKTSTEDTKPATEKEFAKEEEVYT
ncbi:Lysylphosphatidylglycerol synthase TM region [anaerobic digester metagenome]